MKKTILTIAAMLFAMHTVAAIPSQAWSRDINAAGYKDGASIGGFGAGTITWRLNGNFYKNRLDIGTGNESGSAFTDDANAKFYLYQKPASSAATVRKLDSAALGSNQAAYYSLFPKSWVDYYGSLFTVKAKVTQYSPIIPNDYQRVSYPVGIYEWEITNPTAENVDTAIMLTWQNNYTGVSASAVVSGNYRGIVLHRTGTGAPTLKSEGEFCLGSQTSAGVTVSYLSAASLAAIESDFSADGALANTTGNNTLAGISFKVTVAPGATVRIPIVLSWDIPLFQMGAGYKWWREYTRYFGRSGRNAWAIALDALANRASWEAQVDAWQDSVLTNTDYPNWLKSTLFNEMYIYFTAGTVWEAGAASGQADDPAEDMFSHLESYIYDFYGTSDVRFYGSWALFLNWPDIDKQAVKQFADSVYHTRTDRPPYLNTTAHDIGGTTNTFDTAGEPVFQLYNAYTWRDSTNWKDLNSKLVLMIYRDWLLTGGTDTAFLTYCWEPVKRAMTKVKSQDSDGDGMPNSAGIDQTYDDMDLTGDTSYCGSLFLAACQAAKQIAIALGDNAQANTYQSWYDLAQPNFEAQLWNGTYYNIDTGSFAVNRIMSDQLAGHWYSKALELGGVVTDAHAVSAWQKVYDNNYAQFGGGAHGVNNVMNANGTIDTSSPQTQECWVGTSWGVAAGMVQEGMTAQAGAIGQSLYNTIWNTGQYWFRTPEAWRVNLTSPRAFYYMRGSTVWAVKRAYDLMAGPTSTRTATRTFTPVISPTNTTFYTPTQTGTNTPYISPTMTRTPTMTYTYTATPVFATLRVNCAGPQYTDMASNLWLADKAYAAGSWGYTVGGTQNTVTDVIAGTVDDILYRTEFWGATLAYAFDIPDGNYQVTLKFAELWYGIAGRGGLATGVGSRLFNVAIEGAPVLTNFDIFAVNNAADYAVDMVFNVTVSDGQLNINFTAGGADNPSIEAIMIAAYIPTPTITPTVSRTNTFTPSLTRTNTPTQDNTASPTITHTNTKTVTPVETAVNTPADSPTESPTSFNTATPQETPTHTNTVDIPSATNTVTLTATGTHTRTQTVYQSPTQTPTITKTSTGTPPTLTMTPTVTRTAVNTATLTVTLTSLPTNTPVDTAVPTNTVLPSHTETYSVTATQTMTEVPAAATLTHTPTMLPTVANSYVYPNPCNPIYDDVNIAFNLDTAALAVRFEIYSVSYRKLRQISLGVYTAGTHRTLITKDKISGLASGIYYYLVVYDKADGTQGRLKTGTMLISR